MADDAPDARSGRAWKVDPDSHISKLPGKAGKSSDRSGRRNRRPARANTGAALAPVGRLYDPHHYEEPAHAFDLRRRLFEAEFARQAAAHAEQSAIFRGRS
jgi:hypothetical protein